MGCLRQLMLYDKSVAAWLVAKTAILGVLKTLLGVEDEQLRLVVCKFIEVMIQRGCHSVRVTAQRCTILQPPCNLLCFLCLLLALHWHQPLVATPGMMSALVSLLQNDSVLQSRVANIMAALSTTGAKEIK